MYNHGRPYRRVYAGRQLVLHPDPVQLRWNSTSQIRTTAGLYMVADPVCPVRLLAERTTCLKMPTPDGVTTYAVSGPLPPPIRPNLNLAGLIALGQPRNGQLYRPGRRHIRHERQQGRCSGFRPLRRHGQPDREVRGNPDTSAATSRTSSATRSTRAGTLCLTKPTLNAPNAALMGHPGCRLRRCAPKARGRRRATVRK